MTLAIDTKKLAALHTSLKGAVDKRGNIPIIGHYRIEASGGALVAVATDFDIECSYTIPVTGDLAPLCVPPYLFDAASGISGPSLNLDADATRATVKAGRAKYTGSVLPGTDFPRLQFDTGNRIEIEGGAFARILLMALAGVNPDDHRPMLQGVLLEFDKDAGSLVATGSDGHRLHSATMQAPQGAPFPTPPIIPAKAVRAIAAIAASVGDAMIGLEVGDSGIVVSTERERIAAKLIDATPMEWRRVVPKPSDISATFDIAEALGALDRIMKVEEATTRVAKGAKRNSKINLAEDGDYLTVRAEGDTGDAADALPAEFAGEWGGRWVDGRYLRDALKAIADNGSETAIIASTGSVEPLRIESPTDEAVLAVIMPVRK